MIIAQRLVLGGARAANHLNAGQDLWMWWWWEWVNGRALAGTSGKCQCQHAAPLVQSYSMPPPGTRCHVSLAAPTSVTNLKEAWRTEVSLLGSPSGVYWAMEL